MSETENKLELVKKDISTQVLAKVEAFQKSGELRIPDNYSPENALKSAYLILSEQKNTSGKFVLDVCTKESIANSLLKMVVWGLSPLKKQCSFIPYGDKLECSPEYTGNIVLAKRYGNMKDIVANAIFKGDTFIFEVNPETGRKKIIEHKQTLESIGSKDVVGAYAVFEMNDGTRNTEIMSISQIRDAWNQGAMKGNSPAHKNFPDEMSKKTTINRACKLLIRGSDDAVLFLKDETEEDQNDDRKSADVENEIQQNANKQVFSFKDVEDANIVNDSPESLKQAPKATPAEAFEAPEAQSEMFADNQPKF